MLVDGKWTDAWQPVQATDAMGGFVRQASRFRNWVTPDGAAGPTGEAGFRAEKGRYHLYAALICPWATRVLIARKLKRLEGVVSVSIVEPALTDQGWRFGDYPGATRDAVNGASYLHEIYTRADPHYTGRATVPALWDRERGTIVNNESADLLRMFNSGFGALASEAPDLYPPAMRFAIDELNDEIYPSLNNGVYRAGFATTQAAYEEAFAGVFAMLDKIENRLPLRPLSARRASDRGRHPPVRDARPLRRRLFRPVQVQPQADRRLPEAQRLSQAAHGFARLPRDLQPRPRQARLLLDQAPQPERDRAPRAAARLGARRTFSAGLERDEF